MTAMFVVTVCFAFEESGQAQVSAARLFGLQLGDYSNSLI